MVRSFGIVMIVAITGACGGAKVNPKRVYTCGDLAGWEDWVSEACTRDGYAQAQIGCLVEQLRDRNQTDFGACRPYDPESAPAARPVHADGPAPLADFCLAIDAAVAASADEFASVTGAVQPDQGDADTAVLATTLSLSPFRCAIEASKTEPKAFLYCESERWPTLAEAESWLEQYADHVEDCVPSSWERAPAQSGSFHGFVYQADLEASDALSIQLLANTFDEGTSGLQLIVDPHTK